MVDNPFEIDETAFLQRFEVIIRWKESMKAAEYFPEETNGKGMLLTNGKHNRVTHVIAEQFL